MEDLNNAFDFFTTKSIYEICARLAALENKCVLVIDNHHFHELSLEKQKEIYEYYKDPIDDDFCKLDYS